LKPDVGFEGVEGKFATIRYRRAIEDARDDQVLFRAESKWYSIQLNMKGRE